MGYKVNPPSADELRQLAINRMADLPMHGSATLTGEQARKLLEEVAIGKVEAEIQNVYLQDTCARLDGTLSDINDLYELAPIACISTDDGGRISKLNQRAMRCIGQDRDALMGRFFADFIPPAQRDTLHQLMRQARHSGEDHQCDLHLHTAQGLLPVQLALSLQGVGQGFHVVLSNIAARMAVEEGLRASALACRQALDASAEGAWEWDVCTDVLQYSPRLAQHLGYTASGSCTDHAGWRGRVHGEDWPGLMASLQPCLAGLAQHFSHELRCQRADGSWLWMACQGVVADRDASGRATRMLGTHRDTSARKRLEAELQQLRGIQRAIFDSFPQYLAVVDAQRRVLHTNDLWNAYALAHGYAYRGGFAQTDFAVLLETMTNAEGETRRQALAGIGDVIEGRVPRFQMEFAAGTGADARRFLMHVMAVREGPARAVVSHQDISRILAREEVLNLG